MSTFRSLHPQHARTPSFFSQLPMQRGRQREDGVIRRQTPTVAEVDKLHVEKSRGERRWHRPYGFHPPLSFPVVATTLAVSLSLLYSWHYEGMEYREEVPMASTRGHPKSRGKKSLQVPKIAAAVSAKNDGDASANFLFTSSRSSGVRRQKEQKEQEQSRIASIEAVVGYLSDLAKLPPAQLWDVLGMDTDEDYGDDPFALKSLEGGRCPWQDRDIATAAPWLPPRPLGSNEIAATYRLGREKATKGREGFVVTDEVALWYEHISKAGGTAFCGLARSNMEQWQVPEYHCMPGKGDLMDGHVGKWTNDELLRHFAVHRHAIVSSEWDPFRSNRLALSGRGLDGGMSAPSMSNDGHEARIIGPRLLFLTTMRDPCDRLLSAYTFFMITRKHNAKNYDPPPFLKWMAGNTKRAAKYEHGTGKRYGLIGWTTNHNHVTWRFSGGMLPPNIPRQDVQGWIIPYEVAIRALCQFDLILPMDVMTKDGLGKAALKRFLGWTNFEARVSHRPGDDDIDGDAKNGHVVSTGRIQNSNARSHFNETDYRRLWEDNWLDHILYLWCRAVFLARLHCDFDS